jgi:hypothetical protein
VLEALGVLSENDVERLAEFAPRPMYNAAGLQVGTIRMAFSLPGVN